MPSQDASQIKPLLASNIDRGMIAKGLNNRELADKIGTTEHQVWRWRRGRHVPTLETQAAIARELFGGDISQFYIDGERAAV